MNNQTFDIAVLGAGPAGAGSALFLARAGFKVALIEKRDLAKAGPSWVNGVFAEAFDAIGLERPRGEEVELADFKVVFFSSDMQQRREVEASGFLNLRMRPFIDRLQRDALAAGVTPFGQMHLEDIVFEGERPVELKFRQGSLDENPETIGIRAKLFVDASGLHGALRREVRAIHELQGEHDDSDLCTAMQENCHIADAQGAREFLRQHRVEPGTLMSILGTAGGYSTMTVHIGPDVSEVGLLAGSIKDPQHPSGIQMLRRFKAEHPWVGERISGGGGTIPLRAPLEKLAAPGIAVVGNAANQVFSTHGSGVMPALQSARILADAVQGVPDPGDPDVLWRYSQGFQRNLGALLASYNLFRKFSQQLSGVEIGKMFRYNLMTSQLALAGLQQVMPSPTWENALSIAALFVQDPAFAIKLTRSLAAMPLVHYHYAHYPESRDDRKLARWIHNARLLVS
jgi:menaquinone-9 beta-reductase